MTKEILVTPSSGDKINSFLKGHQIRAKQDFMTKEIIENRRFTLEGIRACPSSCLLVLEGPRGPRFFINLCAAKIWIVTDIKYSKKFCFFPQPRLVFFRRSNRFRLFPVRSPLLRESRLLSFPPATKMFQFTGLSLSFL